MECEKLRLKTVQLAEEIKMRDLKIVSLQKKVNELKSLTEQFIKEKQDMSGNYENLWSDIKDMNQLNSKH